MKPIFRYASLQFTAALSGKLTVVDASIHETHFPLWLLHSIVGHSIPHLDMVVHMYCAAKHAVTALTEGLRRELVKQNSKIRVSVSTTSLSCAVLFSISSSNSVRHTHQNVLMPFLVRIISIHVVPHRHLWARCLDTMWEPRRLTTLWASTACYRDRFTLPLPLSMPSFCISMVPLLIIFVITVLNSNSRWLVTCIYRCRAHIYPNASGETPVNSCMALVCYCVS
jgi:hypothetical protein